MRIIFMGTPEFAIPSLSLLLENSYDVAAVVTTPDKPQGRGQALAFSAVKQFALKKDLKVLQPESLKDENFISQLKELNAGLFVIVAFRILPREVFTIPKLGAFNLHASLLPKYRGAAPINWAIINGEKETGVTTFFLQEKVDTGNVILQARLPIKENETAGELHDRLAEIGAEIVLHTVRLIEVGKANPKPQDNTLATPAPKIFKEHCRIDWNKDACQIHNLVRGLSPVPCAFSFLSGKMVKIYKTVEENVHTGKPTGVVIDADKKLVVAAKDGIIKILELQLEGKRRLNAEEFLRGFKIKEGDRFECLVP
ncbi:MAG: methionyl-tRNA formyltransferase [Bacteroidota bacterium]|nr:methionyl-tRNA formyltransferase [Bacteroidota bacterium]